jgi:DNA-binding NtrC family response regulator
VSAEREPTRRLLIVDDEARILSALRRTLRREPFEVFTAESASEALQVVDAQPLDVVLSDQKMPGMSGLQLLAEVARRQPDAVRMLITGQSEAIAPADLERVGVLALITKPWDDGRLKETLRRAIPAPHAA